MTIQANASQATPVLIRDMGVEVPVLPDGYAPTTSQELRAASNSEDLRALATDDAFGAGSSTLVIFDGAVAVAQADVGDYLATVHLPTAGPYSVLARNANGDDPEVVVQFQQAALDAFGRQRVSSPVTLLDTQFQYDKQPAEWAEKTTGASSAATLDSASSSILFQVGTGSTDEVIRQTRRYLRYRPGKSQLVFATGVLGAGKANTTRRIGYFETKDGLFFQLSGTTLSVVRRSSVTGSTVDTSIPQASWNLDPLDGTGDSGYTLDTTKAQIFAIDIEWLGVGRVRFGVVTGDGDLVYCHQLEHANVVDTTYMSTANLPVRYELRNAGATASATDDFRQICCTVISEGGDLEPSGRPRSVTTDRSSQPAAANGTLRSVLAIRPKSTLGAAGKINRASIRILRGQITQAQQGDLYYEMILDPTITLTGWTSAGSESAVEYSRTVATYTGGTVIASGFLSSTNGTFNADNADVNAEVYLTLDVDGASPTVAVLALEGLGRTVDVHAEISWREVY